ncbi:SDR family NAD(P)-dependent oxidoreductase [Cellulomonas edaphi]|uniref:SDR family oxidoreductase n=1 Tax=Cellulomonas edaphi TaxID=3053468 RepID=A0ABT7S887_9CELL|nr:SDR family oxidoreductase [Cellulomons edaphi]MDM7831830.1 SDR family oxidoreductase [Cellulomons edaphi]
MTEPIHRTIPSTALVTGAGRGIGRGLALGLARAGFAVALVGRTRAHLDVVADEVRAEGGTAFAAAADLVDATEVADAVARAEVELGGIGLLVNNAGVIERIETDFVEDDVEDSWRVVETNVRGPMLVSHAILPGMLAQGGGRILNVNSGSGYRAGAAYTGYSVSKGALARLTAMLDAQYRDRGVRVLDMAPGHVETDMTTAMPLHDGRSQWTPLDDVAAMAVAFARGELDELSGRFVRVGTDTVDSLRALAPRIVASDARALRLVPYGADDPIA